MNGSMDVGALIRRARDDARLSQRELAERAGVSRYAISRYENGHRLPTIGGLRSILAAVGKQLHAELEPLDADVRAAIARVAEQPLEDRPAVAHWSWLREAAGPEYRVEGVAAASLLGAPLPVEQLDLALADVPETFAALVRLTTARPAISVRRDTWPFSWPAARPEGGDRGAAEAGERLRELLRDECPDGTFWMQTAGYRARVRLVPPAEVATYVEVLTPHGAVRVAPLHEIESSDPQVRRVLRVLSSS